MKPFIQWKKQSEDAWKSISGQASISRLSPQMGITQGVNLGKGELPGNAPAFDVNNEKLNQFMNLTGEDKMQDSKDLLGKNPYINKDLLASNPYIGNGNNIPDIHKRNFIKKGILGLAAVIGIAAFSKAAKAAFGGFIKFPDATTMVTAPAAAGAVTLLKANSGTTTNASAEDVDTVALSGLTALDSLLVYFTLTSVTQQTGNILLRSVTDSLSLILFLNGFELPLGRVLEGTAIIRPGKDDATTYNTLCDSEDGATRSNGNSAGLVELRSAAGTTAFTGSWTLALRHSGVTAGGTLHWSWSVFKMAGQ